MVLSKNRISTNMKKIQFILLLFCVQLSLLANHHTQGFDNKYNKVSYHTLSSLSVNGNQGVSAAYSGSIEDAIIIAGGCNFPDQPAKDGGKKVFYKQIHLLNHPEDSTSKWEIIGELPYALAYGASVTVPEGVICIGGTDGEKSFSDVNLITLEKGKPTIHNLPKLPIALDNFGAAYGGGYIYVAGGKSNGRASYKAYRMSYPTCNQWEELPDISGAARLQPATVVQNGPTGPYFYVMGGYSEPSRQTEGVVHNNGIFYDPKTKSWDTTSYICPTGKIMSLVGAQGVASGSAHIIFFGGVNNDIFEEAINRPVELVKAEERADYSTIKKIQQADSAYLTHPESWYKFNNELIIYHTITDTWTTESSHPRLARAGASIISHNGRWVMVNGESMPGIRSTDVTAVEMSFRTEFGWLNWTVLAVYLLGMLAMGFYFMKREGDSDDFFKGGGRIPWWAAGISIYATMLSAITYMAYPAKAFATDWTYYPMLITILLVSFPVIRYYLPFFRRLNVTSAYEYLEHRFNSATRLMASALFIIFMIARMALVLYLPSLALTAVTGIDIYICIILMGVITIVYCTMGGVEAVVWGDVVQGFILVGGAILAFVYLAFSTEGGFSGFLDIAWEDDKFRLFDWSFDYRSATFWVIILGGMANNLISYTSDQTVIQRYLTTKDERSARQSIMMNGLMSVFISVVFFAIGAGLYTFFKTHPTELDYTMSKADTIFPFFMMSQLPAGIAGLLIAAIFAATMSTISSNINSVATAFSIDFYKRWKPSASDQKMLRIARYSCLISGVIGMAIALLMATWEILSLLDFFQEILGLLSSGLGGLFLMGIFFPRIGGKSALLGFISGVCMVFIIKYFTETSFLLYGFIGLAVSVFVGWASSFVLKENKNLHGLTWKTLIEEEK